jgi:hypothetical protein
MDDLNLEFSVAMVIRFPLAFTMNTLYKWFQKNLLWYSEEKAGVGRGEPYGNENLHLFRDKMLTRRNRKIP